MIARIRQWGGILLAVSVACGSPGEEPADDAADTTAVAPAAPTTAPAAGAATSYSLVVTNPMPHTMIVSMESGEAMQELGAVPANAEQTFTVPAAPGSTVTLLARDEAETHTPTAEVTLPSGDTYAVWRIE